MSTQTYSRLADHISSSLAPLIRLANLGSVDKPYLLHEGAKVFINKPHLSAYICLHMCTNGSIGTHDITNVSQTFPVLISIDYRH